MNRPCFKGAIFDLDGTLWDSMDVWENVDRAFLGKRGIALPDDYMQIITTLSFRAAADYTIERFGLNERPEDLMQEWHDMAMDAYHNHVPLKEGAKEYLYWLKDQGVLLGVATAAEDELFIPALKRCGMYDLFDHITTLKEVKRGKGFPDIYEKAAEKMGLNPCECVVFEDIAAGIRGAKSGGFMAVGIYDDHAVDDHEEMKQRADAFLMSFNEAGEKLADMKGDTDET